MIRERWGPVTMASGRAIHLLLMERGWTHLAAESDAMGPTYRKDAERIWVSDERKGEWVYANRDEIQHGSGHVALLKFLDGRPS